MSDNGQRVSTGETVSIINADGSLADVDRLIEVKKKSAAELVGEKLGIDYQSSGGNGHVTTSEAGEIGGHLGGPMVKKLIDLALEEIAKGHVGKLIHGADEKK